MVAGRLILLESQEEYGIAYGKNHPDLGGKLNKAIDTLIHNGKRDAMIRKWLSPRSEAGTVP
jgi:ABC-type amino acid transport substrate-binding protein